MNEKMTDVQTRQVTGICDFSECVVS